MSRYTACLVIASLALSFAAQAAESKVFPLSTPIDREAAIARALAQSPRLKASGEAYLARKGDRKQAGMWLNPELSVEAENVGGNGLYKGLNSAEVTYGVSQRIEIGGKRSARKDIASLGVQIAAYEQEATRLDVIRDAAIAYAEAVSAREAVTLAEEQKKLAGDILSTVSKRVGAAREPLIQKSKAEVTQATSEIALDKAIRQYETAKRSLAALWNQERTDFELEGSSFFAITLPSPLAVERLAKTPDIAKLKAGLERSRANLRAERANAVPDPNLSAGVRDFRESGDYAYVVGVSLPLPVLNRNQGSIAKARHEVNQTESENQTAEITLATSLQRSQQELETAYHEATSLRDTILPAAKRAFALSREGYQAGKFPYLDVLDAQRTLFATREQLNSALLEYHRKRAEVERLSAPHLSESKANEAPHAE